MVLKHKRAFNKSKPAGFDGLYDWDFLGGLFPRGIMPMDIDAFIENNGHFLFFETKNAGTPIPKGQLIALDRLGCREKTCVFYISGKSAKSFSEFTFRFGSKACYYHGVPGDVTDRIKWICHEWFMSATGDLVISPQRLDVCGQIRSW